MQINLTDAALVERCLGGDKEAFAGLVERHQHAVFGLAMSMTGHNYAEAADLAQEAFISAYKKLHSFDPHYLFRNWVLTICANLTKNRFRSIVRRRQVEENYVERTFAASSGDDPRLEDVEDALRQLPEKTRVPLTLRYSEGLSFEEIASILGIGLSAAKMRVKRGLEELTPKLNNRVKMQP